MSFVLGSPLTVVPVVGFDPVSLITGAGGFWRADQGVTLSGSNVTAWADQTAFGNNLTPDTTNPTFSATGFNSAKSGITYADNSTDTLQDTSVSFPASPTLSIFFLLQKFVSTGARYGALKTASADFATPSVTADSPGSGQFELTSNSVCGNGGAGFTLTANSLYLIGGTFDGANANLWVNGAIQGAATAFTANLGQSAPCTLNSGAVPSVGAKSVAMALAFWGITQKAMNSTDWTNLKNWSNANWGTSF